MMLKTAREAATFGAALGALYLLLLLPGNTLGVSSPWYYCIVLLRRRCFWLDLWARSCEPQPCNSISWTLWRLKLSSWNGGSASLYE
ncbi:hypothetical protein N665_0020s0047 [Sinapis alba]|nr:hypothetical protein N665_0020s0047 [Sinapis alba]